jgi:hypothetical protein
MAIKTFTTGEVLTASDTNTYLANAGLTYITQGTVSANTTLNFTSIFTSAYDNYRVVFVSSANQTAPGNQINLRVRSGSTDLSTGNAYLWSRVYFYTAGSGADGSVAANQINASDSNNGFVSFSFDLYAPRLAQQTLVTGQTSAYQPAGGGPFLFGINWAGFVNNTTSYDGFSLIGTSNFSGTARVYGYRQS